MTLIKTITTLPDWEWSDQAKEELAISGTEILKRSTVTYAVERVAVVGLMYPSLVSQPWLWMLVAANPTRSGVKALLKLVDRIPKGAKTVVKDGWETGDRFAKFFGFEAEEGHHIIGGLKFNNYRRL